MEKKKIQIEKHSITRTYNFILIDVLYRGRGGGGKIQYPYVGFNSSVTGCTIEIILSVMTYYHHWFKEFVKSIILLDCVWPFELGLS